ncbi:DUF420 domain-containing protein [Pseudochryseolinea flava]|uniref:DUF420 domain-containing protein n=2 Tax=Pseudochryseolinea flava TaxID=2059302 RepID=A0A364XWB4_9BACT|nr:DUF420 domain-containing protein [Pseudochryseolinea flava]
MSPSVKGEKYKKLIVAVSIIIPVAVAALFKVKIPGYDLSFLPPIYAGINAATAILLVIAVVAIKNKKQILHETLMKVCIGLSICFLVMYVAYHITSETTHFGGQGGIRIVYFVLLITHIVLSVAIIPLVLFTYVRAWSGDFVRHRRLAKFTFPLWLYVAVTGVVVYLMLSPYYK